MGLANPDDMLGSVGLYDSDDRHKCIYRLHKWLCTQSYIVSKSAMEIYAQLVYQVNVTPPVDAYLANHHDRGRFFTVRPLIGFQRHHVGIKGQADRGETGSWMETFKMVPGIVYTYYDRYLYSTKAKIQPPEECWPATKAYSYPEPSMEVVMNPAPYIKKQFRAFFAFIKSTLGYIPSTDDGWKSIFNLSNSTPPAER